MTGEESSSPPPPPPQIFAEYIFSQRERERESGKKKKIGMNRTLLSKLSFLLLLFLVFLLPEGNFSFFRFLFFHSPFFPEESAFFSQID